MKEMKKELVEGLQNISITENGAIGYSTTGNCIVDMTYKVSSYRHNKNLLEKDFINAMNQCETINDKILLAKWLFYMRDIRMGLGERDLFNICFPLFLRNCIDNKSQIKSLLILITEYGRYDDLIKILLNDEMKKYHFFILDILKETYFSDLENAKNNKEISLLSKWLPTMNVSSTKKKNKKLYNVDKTNDIKMKNYRLAKGIAKHFNLSNDEYRKNLSFLRKYLNIVERNLSEGNFDNIDYSQVPSKASLIYKNAFYRHDKEGYESYITSVSKGDAKINAKTLYPYEIIEKYHNKYDEVLEQLWNALPRTIKEDDGKTMVVRDGSGSMYGKPLDIADSLTLLISEQLKGEFENCFITFSSKPEIVDMTSLKNDSLYKKLNFLRNYNDCSNTDIEKTFDLILNTAVNNHMKQEDLPNRILIISDMEFDGATTMGYYNRNNDFNEKIKTLFDIINNKFIKAGYHMPKLCFWNVCSRTTTIPVKEHEFGLSLVSGFSTNIFDLVLSNKMNPLDQMIDKLNVERYQIIEDILNNKKDND